MALRVHIVLHQQVVLDVGDLLRNVQVSALESTLKHQCFIVWPRREVKLTVERAFFQHRLLLTETSGERRAL